MVCKVIVIGYGMPRSTALDQGQVSQKSAYGVIEGGCPNCTGSGLAVFNADPSLEAVLNTPGTSEMYVLSFSGDTQEAAVSHAKAWITAERSWLNGLGKYVFTFPY